MTEQVHQVILARRLRRQSAVRAARTRAVRAPPIAAVMGLEYPRPLPRNVAGAAVVVAAVRAVVRASAQHIGVAPVARAVTPVVAGAAVVAVDRMD